MELMLQRIARKPGYTIGKMYIDGVYVCDTLEDTDRGLTALMPEREIRAMKVPGKTAIPTGGYRVTMCVRSPKFGNKPFYRQVCDGRLPRLLDVPGYSGVLIHCGNLPQDTDGCILVGENREVGKVLRSKDTFKRLIRDYLMPAYHRNEDIFLTVK